MFTKIQLFLQLDNTEFNVSGYRLALGYSELTLYDTMIVTTNILYVQYAFLDYGDHLPTVAHMLLL